MSDQRVPPPKWMLEHDEENRLSRLSDEITKAIEASPDYGEDIKGIFALTDGQSSGAAMLGYQEHVTTDPIFDLIRHAGILFAAVGVKLNLVADNGEEAKGFDIPQPPLAGNGTGESVTLTVTSDPGGVQQAALCRAVKESVQGLGGDWAGCRVIIITEMPGQRCAIMYHGIESDHQLAHALLAAFQQVAEGDKNMEIMLVPVEHLFGGGPN
jgi:hypothetical protein